MSLQAACDFCWLILLLNILVGISNGAVKNTATTRDDNVTLPIVTISQGTLQGIDLVSRNNRSISAFLGIPYGQPPIGNLRFSSPVAADAWNDTLDASVEGNACPQIGNAEEEDCLYLNVYTLPHLIESNDSSLLPVMVFIPGGGFESGHGDSSYYGPSSLLDADVVLVSINYRVGPLGFLSTGDEVAPGNWGLKDQVLALKWVQDNIADFGGDPNQVTIFGHSAGAVSVQLLAMSESTIGLFHKYISQSGAAFGDWVYRPRSSYANRALQLGEILGCPTNTSSLLIDCLRDFNSSEIINTRSEFYVWNGYPAIWGPTDEPDIDGAFLTISPANLFATGKLRDLPSITGIVKDEGIMGTPGIVPDSDTFQEFLDSFDELLPMILGYSDTVEDVPSFTAALKKFYFDNDLTTNRSEVWHNCVNLLSDAFFIYPTYYTVQKQFAFAENVPFFYFFEYRGTYSINDMLDPDGTIPNDMVNHGDEVVYLFSKRESVSEVLNEGWNEVDILMIDTMVQLWTSFAINGTPTTTATISNTTWEAYSTQDNYLRIGSGSDGALDLQYGFLQERMQFWNELTATGSGNTAVSFPFLRLIFVLLVTHPMILTLITTGSV